MTTSVETPADEAKPQSAEEIDAEIIADAKAFLALCIAAEGGNREEALDDLRFLSGEQWPAEVQRDRDVTKRPCLTINKLPTFLHQVTNDQRMNVPSIEVSPVDSHADIETAEVLQGYIRHAQYNSNADTAYDTAVNSAAAIGFGYFRIMPEFCSPTSFDQDLNFKRIRNPFTVYFDPMAQEADGSDAKRAMISVKQPRKEFERENPGKKSVAQGFDVGSGDPTNKDWWGADDIRTAEFYRIEDEPATLVELTNGEVGYKDDLIAMPEGVEIKRTRESTRPKLMWYKLSPFEVLMRTQIMCRWIPIFPVYGDEIDIDGKIVRSGIIRNAKDPAQMYNYWMTAATEEVALRPKTPYIGAEGQFEGYEDEWNAANVTSFSYLEYKPVTLDGNLAPPPQRQPMADMPSGVLTMAMHANDNIKATTGLFDSSLGALGNARSGVQERSQQRQGDMANFHFTDNLNRTIRHAGRCMVNMIPHYLDAPRLLRVMGEDGTIKSVPVNQPAPQPMQAPVQLPEGMAAMPGASGPVAGAAAPTQAQAIETILHDLTVGEYDVVVKAGPSYSTLRQEAADSMIELGGKWPKLLDVAGDKIIRNLDWPGAQGIADRVAKTIPPELREGEDDEQNAPPPAVVRTPKGDIPVEQASQMLQEMDAQMGEMQKALQEAQAGTDRANIAAQAALQKSTQDNAARVQIAEINAVSAGDVAELNGLIKILIAQQAPPPGLAAEVASDQAKDGSGAAAK